MSERELDKNYFSTFDWGRCIVYTFNFKGTVLPSKLTHWAIIVLGQIKRFTTQKMRCFVSKGMAASHQYRVPVLSWLWMLTLIISILLTFLSLIQIFSAKARAQICRHHMLMRLNGESYFRHLFGVNITRTPRNWPGVASLWLEIVRKVAVK